MKSPSSQLRSTLASKEDPISFKFRFSSISLFTSSLKEISLTHKSSSILESKVSQSLNHSPRKIEEPSPLISTNASSAVKESIGAIKVTNEE